MEGTNIRPIFTSPPFLSTSPTSGNWPLSGIKAFSLSRISCTEKIIYSGKFLTALLHPQRLKVKEKKKIKKIF